MDSIKAQDGGRVDQLCSTSTFLGGGGAAAAGRIRMHKKMPRTANHAQAEILLGQSPGATRRCIACLSDARTYLGEELSLRARSIGRPLNIAITRHFIAAGESGGVRTYSVLLSLKLGPEGYKAL